MDLKQGTVKAFDNATYEATIQIMGSLPSWLGGVAVARNIAAAEMVVDRKCAVVFFDEGNPGDAVVVAVFG